jgi:hypothetical protein
MEQSVLFKEAGRNRQLTERDRDLCGFLAVCRYPTREQVERLMFPGRSKARSSTRLRQLAASVGGQAALLRGDLGFGSADGWTTVWAVTPEGFEVGAEWLDLKLDRVPKHDVGQAFLKHEVMVNEVFLGLVPQDGKTPAKVPRHFRWTLGEYLNLPFEEFDRTALRVEKRRLQPDAMLEDPAHQRRYFIEYETGSATINDAKKSTSTRAKLDRYVAFFNGNYRTHFRDGWRPRLLFVSQSEARAASIAELLNKEGFPSSGVFGGRALTLHAAKHFLTRKLATTPSSPATEQSAPPRSVAASVPRTAAPAGPIAIAATYRPPPHPRPGLETAPALCEAEERLRRGWVSVRGELLIRLEHEMNGVFGTLQKALEMLRQLRAPPGEMPHLAPEVVRILNTFSGYARRAETELARYDLKRADGPPHES